MDQAADHIFHDPIWSGGAGGDADPDRPIGKKGGHHLQVGFQGFVFDAIAGTDAFRGIDVIRTNAATDGNLLQVGGVGRVIATDHHHQIQRFINQGKHGILALLGGITNSVEGEKMLIEQVGAEALQHGSLKQSADLLGFTFEHGRLIRHP